MPPGSACSVGHLPAVKQAALLHYLNRFRVASYSLPGPYICSMPSNGTGFTRLGGLQRNALCKVPYKNDATSEFEPRSAGSAAADVGPLTG